jgi:hypothetical protein
MKYCNREYDRHLRVVKRNKSIHTLHKPSPSENPNHIKIEHGK